MKVPCKVTPRGDKVYARNFIGAAQSQMRILENQMTLGNLKQGVRRVRLNPRTIVTALICFSLREVIINCTPMAKKGRVEFEKLPKLYIYVTISDYVTIWDLKTGEVAKGICNSEGEQIEFPCHKGDLVNWLKGIEDRPTRQLPGIEDNGMDAGNENRIPIGDEGKKGMPINAVFTTPTVRETACSGIPPENCSDPFWLKRMANHAYIEGASASTIHKNIHPNSSLNYPDSWQMSNAIVSYKDGYVYCHNAAFCSPLSIGLLANDTRNVEKYEWRTREFYLTPNNFEGKTSNELILLECDVFRAGNKLIKKIPFCGGHNPYNEAWFCDIAGRQSCSYIFSYRTPIGDLVNDLMPTRKLRDNFEDIEVYQSVQEIVNTEGYIHEYVDMYIERNDLENFGLDHYIKNAFPLSHMDDPYLLLNWAACYNSLGCEELPIPNNSSFCFDKKQIMYYTIPKTFNDARITEVISGKNLGVEGIDDRYAISWCESPTEKQEDWYKIHLFFYTGKVFCRECSHERDWRDFSHTFCEDMHDEDVSEYYIGDRFSSVQATIELEYPEKYKKENTSMDEKPDWVKRYRRPADYSGLGVFPDRESGYPEDEENNTCYPFDGTYDIYTLGEAIEKLINDHYEDKSNDKLLVYLYKRPDMTEKEVT